MPNVREFNAPEGIGLRPTEIGADARAAAARRGGSFFNQAAESLNDEGRRIASTVSAVGDVAVKYMDHREISAGAANGAQRINELNNAWETVLKGGKDADGNPIPRANPNDPTVAAKFREEQLEPALEKFKSGFSTERSQQWAEQFVDNYRKHMFEKTSADMSTMAGIAARTNTMQTVNSLASASYTDPSSLRANRDAFDHALDGLAGSSPNLSVTDEASVRTELGFKGTKELVHAAISGAIAKGAPWEKIANDPANKPFVDRAEIERFAKAAQTQAKVDTLTARQNEIAARQLNERKAESAANENITKNVELDPASGRPSIKPDYFKAALDIAKMPDAPVGLARTLIDWGEHQQNLKAQPQVSDPSTKQELTDRLFSPDKPTTTRDLMIAQTKGKLSDHDFTVMHRLVTELQETPLKGPVWQSTAAAVKDALIVTVPGIPGKDGKGTEAYASFMQSFLPDYIAKSRAGTLEPNALDVKDPGSMISKAMAPFKRSPAQRMQDWVSAAGGIGMSPSERPGPTVAPPTKVSTPADAEKLKPNTRYQTPDGKVYVR